MLKLEGLSIAGFKSFADRTDLSFPDGITGIVGPNGCGKSNVLDAIAWVLGEQSARSLRGSKMEDVIFAGTRSRRAANAAEVTLSFAPRARSASAGIAAPDAVADEIDARLREPLTVTRRLFRNGDSEYLINGQRSRLKDITQLITGTGMGTRVYSIIEQGRVEQILASKPTDRRVLVEEAAGITRYKLKRKAAKLKLEESEQGLLRVTDIILEIEKQLRSLRRQASVARRYRRLAGRQRIVLRALHATRHAELEEKLEAAESELRRHRDGADGSGRALRELEDAERAARERVLELESRRDAVSQQAHEIHLELDRARHLVEGSRERIAENATRRKGGEANKSKLDAAVEALTRRRSVCLDTLERLEADLADARTRLEGAATDARTRRDRLADAHRAIAESKESVFEAMSEAAGARNRRQEIETGLARLHAQAERIGAALAESDAVAADVQSALASGDDRLRRASAAEDNLRARADEAAVRAQALAEQVPLARTAAEEAAARLHESEGRLVTLDDAVTSRSGHGEAVRRIVEEAPAGLLGTVAELSRVRAGDERACEKALGPLLDAVAFSSRKAAEALVPDMASGDRLGLAFAFADEAQAPHPPTVRPPDARVLGSISDSLSFPRAPWLSALVPPAWIVESADDALRLSRKHPNQCFVSRDGALMAPGQGNAGRCSEAGEGLLTTRAKLETLREDVEGLRREATARRAVVAAAERAREESASDRDELNQALTAAEKEVLGSRHALIGLRQAAEAARSRHESLVAEHEMARTDVGESEQRLRELDEALGRCAARKLEAEGRLAEAAALAVQLESEVAGGDAELSRLRELLAVKGERRESATAELEQAERELALARERADAAGQEQEALRMQLEATEQLIGRTAEAITAGELRWSALREELGTCEAELRDVRARISGDADRLRDLRARHDRDSRVAADHDVRRERLQSELEHLIEDCRKELGLHPEEIPLPQPPADADDDEEAAPPPRLVLVRSVDELPDESTEEAAASDESAAAEAEEDEAAEAETETEDVPVSEALPWVGGRLDVATLGAEAETLRRKLARIGPVNLVAIEEYDQLAERHRFLTTEQADLVAAIAGLRQTISEIDETSRERFVAAFEAIKVAFDEAFQLLFRGGRAELRLQDDGDPLECGIEIIAQPPGKRLQNMMLLSGGEKALAAIALLVALFRYKPSPFCILDEVDAPLDESNVLRFIEMVERLSQDTQFIVITHNRRSMERTDVLYGVTMEEPGCSKLVSVRFDGLRAAGSAA